jgi:DNA-binding GntR family transcriptional regulator
MGTARPDAAEVQVGAVRGTPAGRQGDAGGFGVSQAPLREALRLLQEEGLIEAESNRRARVATFHLDDLEAIAAQRIPLSALATAITVPQPTDADIAGWSALSRP